MQGGVRNLTIANAQAAKITEELSSIEPALSPWHSFIHVLSNYYHEQKLQENTDCELHLSLKENALSAFPKVSIAVVKNNEILFRLRVSEENQDFLLVAQNQNEKHSIQINTSDIQAIDDFLTKNLQELKEIIAPDTNKVKEILEETTNKSQSAAKNLTKIQTTFKGLVNNHITGLIVSVGISCLIAFYGKPIAAVFGRELFELFYRTVYGTPEYSWWNPISIYNYNTYYFAPREHIGKLFYDHAHYILSTMGLGSWLVVRKVSQNLYAWIRGRKQSPQPEASDVDILCSDLQNMTIKQPLSFQEQIAKQSALILSKRNKLPKEHEVNEENRKTLPKMQC
ncbi:MAG TPA: hypothetical protein VFP93_02680 [Gammaproteobacteria bacterium]|nr:hypothetical protein [Gammaproteobacteria bacterium]